LSTLCLKYYAFLANALELDLILDKLKYDGDKMMSWSLNHDFINCNVQELIDDLPKYLNFTEYQDYSNFKDLNSREAGYNHNKIYNATMLSKDRLEREISNVDSVLTLQNMIRKTPIYLDDQIKEYTLQSNYVNKINEYIFNKNLYIYNYQTNDYPIKFSNLLYNYGVVDENDTITKDINNHSFFHIYFLNVLINYIFYKRSDLRDNLLMSIKDFTLPTITKSIDDHLENVIDIVLMNQFNFTNVDSAFKDKIKLSTDISNSVSDIEDLFKDYITNNENSFKYNIAESFFDMFNQKLSFNLVNNNYSSNEIFDFNSMNTASYNFLSGMQIDELLNLYTPDVSINEGTFLHDFENAIYLLQLNILNKDNLFRYYYYLLYLYRGKLQRFINMIDPIVSEYVYNNIDMNSVYYFSNFKQMNDLFAFWSGAITYSAFNTRLNNYFTKTNLDSVLAAEENQQILRFVLAYEYRKMIETFVETDAFKQKVIEIHRNIYSYLRSNGVIRHDVDWCGCTKPLEIYLFFALNNMIEGINIETLNDYVQDQIEKSIVTSSETDSVWKSFENNDEFDLFVNSFSETNSYYMFEFYKNFITSLVAVTFAKSAHRNFGLKT